jgi:hypothetical protein
MAFSRHLADNVQDLFELTLAAECILGGSPVHYQAVHTRVPHKLGSRAKNVPVQRSIWVSRREQSAVHAVHEWLHALTLPAFPKPLLKY